MALADSFRTARWFRTFHLVLQAVLFLTFFAGLNYVANDHPKRFDLTKYRSYSLSPETLSYLHLEHPVHIIVTLSDGIENPEVRGLLREFVYATATSYDPKSGRDGRITVDYVDVYQNRRKAEEFGVEQPNAVVFLCGDRRRTVLVEELYHKKTTDRDTFLGEQILTAAILDVSNRARQKIYFLVGHAEFRPDETDSKTGLSTLRDQLKVRNFDVDAIDLTITRKIYDDASLLVIVAPQSRYTPEEQELLRQYLRTGAGRVILLLAPGASAINLGLDDLLFDWGVLVDDDLVCDTGAENLTEDNDLLIHGFRPGHPITQPLFDRKVWLRFGFTRTVRPDPGRSAGNGLNTVTIAATSKTAWGEVGYHPGQTARFSNPGNIHPLRGMDPPDTLGVIVASERVTARDNLPFSVRGGRLVVFGTGDLVSNTRIGLVGNLDVFLAAVNWTVDRDSQLNIPSRPIERFQLSLSAGDLLNLRYTLLLALPAGAALLGLLVYWTRRS
jgi:hypothetical protein